MDPGTGMEDSLAGLAGVESCFCCCLNLESWKKRPRMAFKWPSWISSGETSSTETPLARRKPRHAWIGIGGRVGDGVGGSFGSPLNCVTVNKPIFQNNFFGGTS